jgi:hypothetical protein
VEQVMTKRHIQVAAELLEAAQKRAAQAEARTAQAEADRDVLAAEVEANRLVTAMAAKHENNGQRWNLACKARRLAVDATDKSGALTRAKEVK